jgi:hypothetical protein
MAPPSRTLGDDLADLRDRLFVGREAELARLLALLEPGSRRRAAWIGGSGGVGKSELPPTSSCRSGLTGATWASP